MGKPVRRDETHDDIRTMIRSSLGGATQWVEEAITGTTFVEGCLRNNSSDYFQFKGEPQHKRKLQSLLADIHLHYILQANATAPNQTIVFDIKYCWLNPKGYMPADADWINAGTVTITLTGTPLVRYYDVIALQTLISPPANESYGSMLFFQVVRGNGTYTGNIAICDAGGHTIEDRNGSLNASND